jgi:tetratricopeptide (TPR) repeat protein
LDFWGVQLQRNDRLREAAGYFDRAKDLYHDNVVAEVNLQCNGNLQAGEKSLIQRTKFIQEQLGKYRNLEDVMNANGPFDEATFCYVLGTTFFQGGNFRQAAEELHRAAFLAPEDNPENLASRLMYARASLIKGAPEEALKSTAEIHSHSATLGLSRTNAADLVSIELYAWLMAGDKAGAEKAVQATLEKYPGDEELLGIVMGIYLNVGLYSNALEVIEQQLRIRPNDSSALVGKGFSYLRLGEFSNAIPPLSEVIKMGTNNASDYYFALSYRGLAFWKEEKLNEAQKDYEVLQKAFPAAMQFSYGLGEIAFAKKDTNAAIRHYQLFLAGTPPTNAPETSNALARLKELRRFQR